MVPNGWSTYKFSEIVKETQLGTTERHKGEFCSDPIPLLKMGNLSWGGFDLKSLETLPRSKVDETLILQKGDFLFNTRNTPELVGKSAVWNGELTEAVFDNNINRIVFHNSIDPFYLGSYLNNGRGKSVINSLPAGSTSVAAIYWKDLKNIKLTLPPLPEQRKIAKILSTWDKAISTTEKLIETSKQQKKALMQQLLTGKKRLVNPETGKVFEGEWEEFKLGELFAERVETKRDDLPLLSITSSDGVVYQEDTGRKNTSNDDKSKYRRICVNDIGYNTMRMWQGRSSISNKEGIVSPAYTILIPQQNVAPMYASYLFKLPRLVHVFERNSQGLVSDTWNLKYPHFAKIKWSFPCLKEQQKIAAILTAADKEIEVLEAKLSHFKQEKKALMQQLLTGKRRVSLSS
ncbi:restriction endonuclease subunit S [Shewanella algae]|uniref:restriction endonuclease subunit S n=1 Tax=Shewanella algae TaxID=38313 RepID=UPI0031F56A85